MTDNFAGYFIKVGTNEFRNPQLSKDNCKIAPSLVQVQDADRAGSGKATIKELPHKVTKVWVSFPPLTPTQFRTYYTSLNSMSLSLTYWDETANAYKTGVFYHSDFIYSTCYLSGQRMIIWEPFELIMH